MKIDIWGRSYERDKALKLNTCFFSEDGVLSTCHLYPDWSFVNPGGISQWNQSSGFGNLKRFRQNLPLFIYPPSCFPSLYIFIQNRTISSPIHPTPSFLIAFSSLPFCFFSTKVVRNSAPSLPLVKKHIDISQYIYPIIPMSIIIYW